MKKFKLIAGPCVVEDWLMLSEVRSELKRISKDLDIDFIFKASYKKANRTSDKSFVGLEQDQALTLMSRERPIITDVHECKDVAEVVNFVDALQICMKLHKCNTSEAKCSVLGLLGYASLPFCAHFSSSV